ncbi:hypothetical protein NMG60_11024264 [Bertholletia excelsa]
MAPAPQSPTSSPTHEFSFAISTHPPPPDKAKSPLEMGSPAVDLSPADEIFFHGHLLPLHFLSPLPTSPRSSINSLDSFTLPVTELLATEPQEPHGSSLKKSKSRNSSAETNEKPKPKLFWLFSPKSKSPKGFEVRQKTESEKQRIKPRFDVGRAVKRYVKVIKPLLSFRGRKQKYYTFSGELTARWTRDVRVKTEEVSAPTTAWTSPANSGHLTPVPSSVGSDFSTMEELQAAIQAAIAHCKNSIAVEGDNVRS